MTSTLETKIAERVSRIEATPAIPAIFLPLLEMLNAPPDQVKLDKVVELVSYDNTIAAQCLRVASSPLFGMTKSPESIKGAVISLGLRRVETILLTCCLSQAFPARKWIIDPSVFWRHSLGCAMVCRKFAEKLKGADSDEAYMAGLLHDIGFLVNCLAFPEEFSLAMEQAHKNGIPFDEAESATMGFTHQDTGAALARQWNLSSNLVQVIAHHHAPEQSKSVKPLVALVHLCDLLCRMRGLGYGYYENRRHDLAHNPAWQILLDKYRELEGVDLARFTFELDEAVGEICELVATIFGASAAAKA
jgi:putative nucleotidyltransferase with HDIG domain